MEVEVHYRPSFLLCFWHDRKLQKYYERVKEKQFSHRVMLGEQGEIAIPTAEFNLIFQLTHIYAHLMNEGIGLRQLLDYYFVVCDFNKVYQTSTSHSASFSNHPVIFSNHPVPLSKEGSTFSPSPSSSGSGDVTAPSRCSEPLRSKDGGASKPSPNCAGWDRLAIEGDNSAGSTTVVTFSVSTALVVVQRELKHLGLWRFAGAVMYVLHETLGLSEEKMIAPMDEKRGKLLLAEILNGGNFGRHFTKYGHFTQQGMAKKYFLKIWRNMHFVRYYPAEALSEPIFRTWHFFWRLKHRR